MNFVVFLYYIIPVVDGVPKSMPEEEWKRELSE